MPDISTKPVIFISFSHKDEPEKPAPGETAWLTFVQSFLAPVVKAGVFELWTDEHLHGGDEIDPAIAKKLAACDIFVLLVSRHSLASAYVVDKEITTIEQRQQDGEDVRLFPIVLSPFPKAALGQVEGHLLRPKNGDPLSLMSKGKREMAMAKIADEIAEVAREAAARKADHAKSKRLEQVANGAMLEILSADDKRPAKPASFDISHLPETSYERLVGRDEELARLDAAWVDPKINTISLIAGGGAGKSAIVNEWLGRMRLDRYDDTEAVLGWSFYSQGARERATSADQFLNWAIEKLGIEIKTPSATAKGEAIADAIGKRRILLVLDGCEPLQHGLDRQQGELKDHALSTMLRRFSAMPPSNQHGLIIITSRLPIKDIARWKESGCPIIDLDTLSGEAGAALLRDNGVWGTDKELIAASGDFGGHPLALALLASFLKENHVGDVRKRDRVRSLLRDGDDPHHDHAKRVMETYETDWLANAPVECATMFLMGLFDRPANPECLRALCEMPAIPGLTGAIIKVGEKGLQSAIARLRDVRLLSPRDPSAPEALDAHPLIRDWFGKRLQETNEVAWQAAHDRLYEHLRKSTPTKRKPSFDDLAPLYQAITHGCKARKFNDAFEDIYLKQLCRQAADGQHEYYSNLKLGAIAADLSALGWFFENPYVKPSADLSIEHQSWLLCETGGYLRAQGRLVEAFDCYQAGLEFDKATDDWTNASITAGHLAGILLLMGNVKTAIVMAQESRDYADLSRDKVEQLDARARLAHALLAAGESDLADAEFKEVERRAKRTSLKALSPRTGHFVREYWLGKGEFKIVSDIARSSVKISKDIAELLAVGLDAATLGSAHLGQAVSATKRADKAANYKRAKDHFEVAVDRLLACGQREDVARGMLARAVLHRGAGDWDSARCDIDYVAEIADPGPMKLYLCDLALERARVAFARAEAVAPLHGLIAGGPPRPVPPGATEQVQLRKEAAQQVAIAAEYITECGYHRRDQELDELQDVMRGKRKFADLPPRV